MRQSCICQLNANVVFCERYMIYHITYIYIIMINIVYI